LQKYGVAFGIIGYLCHRAAQQGSFSDLVEQPKNWGMLLAACGVVLAALLTTFVRWYLLVRALGLAFTLREAFRLSFLGYFLNLFAVGIAGSDVVKAVFIARDQPGRRTDAVATVVVDRMIGIYALLIVASVAFLVINLDGAMMRNPDHAANIERFGRAILGITIVATIGIALLLVTSRFTGSMWDSLTRLPRVGRLLERPIAALRTYRRNVPLLVVAGLMSLGSHSLFAMGIYLVARGLPGEMPGFGAHFVIVPIALSAGALPLPGGLGAQEGALELLYRAVASTTVVEGRGLIVALGFRAITMLVAVVGMVYYLSARREVGKLIEIAEQEN
jgi:uncharacterized protein (TIRG00374 family)